MPVGVLWLASAEPVRSFALYAASVLADKWSVPCTLPGGILDVHDQAAMDHTCWDHGQQAQPWCTSALEHCKGHA